MFLFGSFLRNCVQESELLKPTVLAADLGVRNVSTMPAPKKLVHQASNEMPPPPPRTMPPPPPKFTSSTQVVKEIDENNVLNKTKSDDVPGMLDYTLFLLVSIKILMGSLVVCIPVLDNGGIVYCLAHICSSVWLYPRYFGQAYGIW